MERIPTVSHRRKRQILMLCVASFFAYVLLNLLAMLLYPGGTDAARDVVGYSFFENFSSDLGTVRTYGGQAKTSSTPG